MTDAIYKSVGDGMVSVVRPSSVKTLFVLLKFGENYLSTLFLDHFFFFFKNLNFLLFCAFCRCRSRGRKLSNDISESRHQVHSKKA